MRAAFAGAGPSILAKAGIAGVLVSLSAIGEGASVLGTVGLLFAGVALAVAAFAAASNALRRK
ncbi:MAG TPA: hypothetical protein VHG93_02720 [Longimicrobium sp.]|nr:hypothetical protein [Longimicrobium sp.]